MTNNADAVASLAYATSESIRTSKGQTPEGLAFQIAAEALYSWPLDAPFTEFDAKLIDGNATDIALTIRLRALADW